MQTETPPTLTDPSSTALATEDLSSIALAKEEQPATEPAPQQVINNQSLVAPKSDEGRSTINERTLTAEPSAALEQSVIPVYRETTALARSEAGLVAPKRSEGGNHQ